MASSGYTAITFVANEQPTTAKWNLIGSNDASFNNGNGFEDDIIINRHIADDAVQGENLSLESVEALLGADFTTSSASFVDSGLKVTLPAIGKWLVMAQLRGSTGASGQYPKFRFYNQTTAAAISNTERIGVFTYSGVPDAQATCPIMQVVTTASINNIIRVEVLASAGTVKLLSNTAGYSHLLALRIG